MDLLERAWNDAREEVSMDLEMLMNIFGDELEHDPERKWGGSKPGKAPNAQRDFEEGDRRIFKYYFADKPVFNATQFRRRFRMRRTLFMRVMNDITSYDPWFQRKIDALANGV